MSIQTITQEAASIANALSVVVIGVGYYFLIKLYREWIRQNRESRVAGGRPTVVVNADYSRLPRVSVVVRNFAEAPAKEISFDFSTPLEDSSGFVISDLPYLKKGLPFLEPKGEISRYWDSLPDLALVLREKGLEDSIKVTTRYKDLAGESYESEWKLDPLLFEGGQVENQKGMNDLVKAVEKIPGGVTEQNGRRRVTSGNEG